MSIIILPKEPGKAARRVSRRTLFIGLVLLLGVFPATSLYLGYWAGSNSAAQAEDVRLSQLVKSEIASQRDDIEKAKQEAQENLNALTLRLAELQSRVIRLDAVGQRLTEMAQLDKGEFDFENPPAQGGPVIDTALQNAQLSDFVASFDVLSQQLEDREQQLSVLESLLMSRNLEDEVFPAGFPAEKGWVSSFFGKRTDPFTGRPAIHEGIDIAGKLGSGVLAVASGVVTWSGERYGYGQLVEINHGNGYVTRYAHNSEILVHVGDTVKKGQRVALMGSSGRSTGPHVHFELIRNGRVINPLKYVRASR